MELQAKKEPLNVAMKKIRQFKGLFLAVFILSLLLFSETTISTNTSTTNQTILLTGFGPFLNVSNNPTQTIVKQLNNTILANATIYSIVLPVSFDESILKMKETIDQVDPDLIISLGLEQKSKSVHLELLGANIKRVQLSSGRWSLPHFIVFGKKLFYASTLPLIKIKNNLQENNIPADLSLGAGTYVCNAVFYQTQLYLDSTSQDIPMGFVHLPQDQSIDPNGLPLDLLKQAVERIIVTSILN